MTFHPELSKIPCTGWGSRKWHHGIFNLETIELIIQGDLVHKLYHAHKECVVLSIYNCPWANPIYTYRVLNWSRENLFRHTKLQYCLYVSLFKGTCDLYFTNRGDFPGTPTKPGVQEAGQASPLRSHTSMHLLSKKWAFPGEEDCRLPL